MDGRDLLLIFEGVIRIGWRAVLITGALLDGSCFNEIFLYSYDELLLYYYWVCARMGLTGDGWEGG